MNVTRLTGSQGRPSGAPQQAEPNPSERQEAAGAISPAGPAPRRRHRTEGRELAWHAASGPRGAAAHGSQPAAHFGHKPAALFPAEPPDAACRPRSVQARPLSAAGAPRDLAGAEQPALGPEHVESGRLEHAPCELPRGVVAMSAQACQQGVRSRASRRAPADGPAVAPGTRVRRAWGPAAARRQLARQSEPPYLSCGGENRGPGPHRRERRAARQ